MFLFLPWSGYHGRESRSPVHGRRSRSSHKTNSPKVGHSQSHSQGFGNSRPTSPSPTQIPVAIPLQIRSPQPVRQLTFVQDLHHAQPPPDVVIQRAPLNKKASTTVVNRSHSHRPNHSSRFLENQRSKEGNDRDRSQGEQRSWSTEPRSDRSLEHFGNRQSFVHRFTIRIPSRSRSRHNRAPSPLVPEPNSTYLRTGNSEHRE